MPRTLTIPFLALLLALTGLTTGCDHFVDPSCGCTPPPLPTFTATQLTQTSTWWLQEIRTSTQTVKGNDIKDRFSLSFQTDGSYTQTLLSDETHYQGTWMLMGTRNSTLHTVDHKGDTQEYTLQGANPEVLYYSRLDKNGQATNYTFTAKQ
ncbi:hypothetical protein [Hymenobacter wooponensis]|uniref:Lipocalin-like domain-containing protein n=1 Tax=Hymenobacter wooponensis TaxID=1525360 RepID=A0A4Z0MSD7_9BACT|nr:hypothetical protein [Hymenobacter wooponensis]TGD82713.1 hypothetical protein EU557_02715 [Hymenobacter wooponensis]